MTTVSIPCGAPWPAGAGGFAVLMAIPFKSLRIPPDSGGTWGIALPADSAEQRTIVLARFTRRVEASRTVRDAQRPERVSGGRNIH